jgi:hypothetical protein
MSKLEDKPTSTRCISLRTSLPSRGLSQIVSGRQSHDHYRDPQYSHDNRDLDGGAIEDETSDDLNIVEEGEATAKRSPGPEPNIGAELRDDVDNERDLEVRKLDKTKTSGSRHGDPNLVTWDGPDDPENPRNWTFQHKWAATLVG